MMFLEVFLRQLNAIVLQMNLMKSIRDSIKMDKFPEFVKNFFNDLYPDKNFPNWAMDALASVEIFLNDK